MTTVISDTTLVCPKCGYGQPDGQSTCERCGLIFARYKTHAEPPEAIGSPAETGPPASLSGVFGSAQEDERRSLDRDGRRALAIGVAMGVLVFAAPFLNFLAGYLAVLVHEFGHAAAGWLFGFAAVPAFDFVYGGGVTMLGERNTGILVAVYAGFAFIFWLFRRNRPTLVVLAGCVVVYSAVAFSRGHECVHLAAGHLSELVFAAIFLYRGMSGVACRLKVERPLYMAMGSFLVLNTARFSHRLMSSAAFRAEYESAKGGGQWMDLSRLADEFFRTDLQNLAGVLLLLAILTPAVAWLGFRNERRALRLLSRRLDRNP